MPSMSPLRVLLVDDDPDEEVLTGDTLAAIPGGMYAFSCVRTAREGLAAILAGSHDIFLLDYQLGSEDGLSLLRAARAAGSQAPILLLTGLGNREIDQRAMAAGASDYLPKADVTPGSLERAIRHAIDRAAILARLRARTAELSRSNAELEEFAAVVSHDLRSPMQTIAAYAELLEQRYQDKLDPPAQKMIDRLVAGVTRLERMLSELLEFARVGTPRISNALVSLDACLDRAVSDNEDGMSETGATLLRPHPLPQVPGNSVLLTQVFTNLLGNALKFRREGGPVIEVRSRRETDHWCVEVEDDGMGISPADLSRVFMIFHRSSAVADRPGTGIGLAICKKIVERHGGALAVESVEGQWTRFTFRLPLVAPEQFTESTDRDDVG